MTAFEELAGYEPSANDDDESLTWEAVNSNPFHEVNESSVEASEERPERSQILDGEAFVFGESVDDELVAIWGTAAEPLWTAGEGLMIVAPEGVGKTTVAQQVVLARIGLRDSLLGRHVVADDRPVLYLALDRPRQIKRSLERMVDDVDPGHAPRTDGRLERTRSRKTSQRSTPTGSSPTWRSSTAPERS